MPRTSKPHRHPPTTAHVAPAVHDSAIIDSMDDLLDEIDSVLEDNALETVRLYRQRGGE